MDSHIQINQSILFRFSHKEEVHFKQYTNFEDFVYYFDMSTSCFNSEKVNNFGTKPDYYEKDVEKDLLANKIEGPFGELAQRINKSKDISQIKLTEKEKEIILNYSFYSSRRSEGNIDAVIEYFRKIGKEIKPSDVLRADIDKEKVFPYSKIMLISNQTDADFVVPFNCLIYLKFMGKKCCILPISTKRAICIYEFNSTSLLPDFIEIGDENTIDLIDLACFDVENKNKKIIICKEKRTIERLCKISKIEIKQKECDA